MADVPVDGSTDGPTPERRLEHGVVPPGEPAVELRPGPEVSTSTVHASGQSSVAVGGDAPNATIITGTVGTFVETVVVNDGAGLREIQIRVHEQDGGAGFRSVASLPGEWSENVSSTFTAPASELEIRSAHQALERGQLADRAVREIGARLFSAIFVGKLGEVYAQGRQRGVAYRLRFVLTSPGSERIPWELLYDPERAELLAEVGTVVRSIEHRPDAEQRLTTGPIRAPLHLLVAEGSSAPAGRSRRQTLAAAIGEALGELEGPRTFQIGSLGRAQLGRLGETVRAAAEARARRPFHLLHLVCEAVCEAHHDASPDRTLLLFDNGQGEVEQVEPTELVAAVQQRGVRIVVLTTPSSSRASALDVARAFGPPLLRAGLLAVVVLPIGDLDDDVGLVLRELYDGLLRGLPIDVALTAARLTIAPGPAFDRLPMGAPICYLTARGEPRLDVQAPRPTPLRLWTLPAWTAEHLSPAALLGISSSVIALLVGIAALALALGPDWWEPRPTSAPEAGSPPLPHMGGDVNIAITDLGRWEGGTIRPWPNGRSLAASLAKGLEDEVDGAAPQRGQKPDAALGILDVWVHGPDKTRPVTGDTVYERAESARALADEVGADIVVYGNLAEDAATFVPEIYLSNRLLAWKGSTTDAGRYNFGELKLRDGAMLDQSADDRIDLREALSRQARALVYFSLGLNAYASNRPDRATERFQAALATVDPATAGDDTSGGILSSPSPSPSTAASARPASVIVIRSGAELMHVFLGNVALSQVESAAVGQTDTAKIDADRAYLLNLAKDEYTLALKADPRFARANVGLAETWFLRSSRLRHDSGACFEANTDRPGVERAIGLYRAALDAGGDSVFANVEAKSRFGIGRASMCLILARSTAYTPDAAEQELQAVVEEYRGGNTAIGDWARESLVSLSTLRYVQGPADGQSVSERAALDLLAAIEIDLEINNGNASDRLKKICEGLGGTEARITDAAARPSQSSSIFQQANCLAEYERGLRAASRSG